MKISIIYIFLVLLLLEFSVLSDFDSRQHYRENERQALLDFKQGVIDRSNRLSSWVGHHCCSWKGVGCDNSTGHVVMLDLPYPGPYNFALDWESYWEAGDAVLEVVQVNSSLVELKQLRYLDLSSFSCKTFTSIPDLFGSFHELRYLNLSLDSYYCNIFNLPHHRDFLPTWWQRLKNLEILNLSNKSFVGPIPSSLGALSSLKELHLNGIGLNGSIPMVLGNLHALAVLDLGSNNLSGEIPVSLGKWVNLKHLDLSDNSGLILDSIGKLTNLIHLDLSAISLGGQIPVFIEKLSNLTHLVLHLNSLSGNIPDFLGKLSNLKYLDLSVNSFSDNIPDFLGKLSNLKYLALFQNSFSGNISDFIGKLSNLVHLDLSFNSFSGNIPYSIGYLTNLTYLDFSDNKLVGQIPTSLGQLSQLITLDLSKNTLSGEVTEMHFAKLKKIIGLDVQFNPLLELKMRDGWVLPSDKIRELLFQGCRVGPQFPSWIQSQTKVNALIIPASGITDSIPSWISHLTNLDMINLSRNQIHGKVPDFVVLNGASLYLGSNRFQGPLPYFSSNVSLLDLSYNNISGPLGENKFPGVQFLDLSNN